MVIVYIWNAEDETYGHASLRITNLMCPPDEVYISWWPINDGEGFFCSPAHRNRTYDEDVHDEVKQPDHSIRITGLYEEAIKSFWTEWKRKPEWCTYERNCSTTVAHALEAGGAGHFLGIGGLLWDSWAFDPWTPADTLHFAQSIVSGQAAIAREAAQGPRRGRGVGYYRGWQ